MDDLDREMKSADSGVLLVRRPSATLRVTGKDRQTWLNGLVTQDLAPRKSGDAVLALVVAKTGKIEAEVAIVLGDEDALVSLPADRAERLRDKLDRHLIMEDAAIELVPGFEWVFAHGPKAADALTVARSVGARGGLTTRAGSPLAVLVGPSATDLENSITASVDPSAVASEAGHLRFRVERGIAERGVDFTDDESYPQEAALEKDEVSFSKGCYLGQEAVFMLEKRGHVSKRLVQLTASVALAEGAEVRDAEGKSIGTVTSAARRGGSEMVLGIVKYKHAREGNVVSVVTPEGVAPARVTALLAITPES